MWSFLKPEPHKPLLPKEKIDPTYKKLRLQVFLGIFIGYAGYYLVRKNFTLAMPYLQELGFDKGDLGVALSANAIAYGISKFLMGGVSDRSSARKFLPLGLVLSALVTLFLGTSAGVSSIVVMFITQFLIGWFQGMGWPPCGRTMVHWWSQKERGGIVSVWNCAHNVGGGIPPLLFLLGMAWFNDWHAALYMPAFGAILLAIFAFAMMRDTPQSCGLPPIEEYKNDYPDDYSEKHEEELTAKQIFMQYILPNKLLWYIAIAHVFVYLLRYGILDKFPILIAEKMGPHFAVGDTCYSWFEDSPMYNPDGKEMIARDNEVSILRKEDVSKAYFGVHTDITIPYKELERISAVHTDGTKTDIILDGRFVLAGLDELNRPLDEK